MTFLTQHLPFSASTATALPPAGSHVVISDTLSSPGYFALYHLVSAALGEKRQVIWVDFRSEGRDNWETILRKLGTSPPAKTAKDSFVHIQPSSLPDSQNHGDVSPGTLTPALFNESSQPCLRATFDAIRASLKPSTPSRANSNPLLILDGLTELVCMGFEPVQVSRFVRAVLASAREASATLVSTLHADNLPLTPTSTSGSHATFASVEADLLERVLRTSNCWWRISGLASGRSGNVSGEISSHPFVPFDTNSGSVPDRHASFPRIPRSNPLQYRLESNTVKVFPKGTGRGYL